MCNRTGIAFAERSLTAAIVSGSDVLEVGSYDVNGSVRPHVESLGPRSYLGVDIMAGPRVDRVLDVKDLVAQLGAESADIVISTEMIEHVRDWRTAVTNLKSLLRPGAYLLITTRSAGFPYHAWPYDFWRYELDDFRKVFGDLDILSLESDTASPGVFLLARRPEVYSPQTPELALRSIVTGRRQTRVTDAQIRWFKATAPARFAVASIRRRLIGARRSLARTWGRTWDGLKRVPWRRHLRNRVIRPTWTLLPLGTRVLIKRALGRGG